ncbi:unnamed protein product [Prorocentrum cordatum]|uniref:Uncharacterized protein n=1 Tax=Prorocentrum cordatum TaxID=2364126 RepID=A0ABN9TDZ9_9DINO|nr:unnamed protein product [Polarella glacialis]
MGFGFVLRVAELEARLLGAASADTEVRSEAIAFGFGLKAGWRLAVLQTERAESVQKQSDGPVGCDIGVNGGVASDGPVCVDIDVSGGAVESQCGVESRGPVCEEVSAAGAGKNFDASGDVRRDFTPQLGGAMAHAVEEQVAAGGLSSEDFELACPGGHDLALRRRPPFAFACEWTEEEREEKEGSPALAALVVCAVAYGASQAFSLARARPGAAARHRQPLSLRRAEAAAEVASKTGDVENYEFQAEVGKVMDIIVNSLYSNKDVFLRELVSNAADACDKKRFLALTESDAPPEAMKLRITTDKDRRSAP